MPDISKCANNSCRSKKKCYRFTCEPSEYRQSYALFDPKGKKKCDYFMPNDNPKSK